MKINNKSNKIKKNILFIFLVILIITGICFFNYRMDPYSFFKNKHYMILSNYPTEMIYTVMKIYKDQKADTVVIGGSDAWALFNELFKRFFNNLSFDGINYSQYKEILDNYLKFHPETKKVIIVINYINIINDIQISLPECKETNLTLREYQNILFSTNATMNSLLLLKDSFVNKYINTDNTTGIDNKFFIEFKPKQSDKFESSLEELDRVENKNFNSIISLIKMLDEKNIDYVFIIPPYNSVFLAITNGQKNAQKKIDNFKRFLVKTVPEDKKIYDFAFVNKYTSSDLSENKDALYINLSHPSIIFGTKIFKILYKDKDADKSIYFLLNRKNIESVIKKENNLLTNYIKNNYETIQYYKELRETQREEDILYLKRIYEDSFSDDSKQEYEYLTQKIAGE